MRQRLFKRTRTGEYHFQFLSDSDKKILSSQGYTTKDDRNTGIQSVYKNAGDANRYSKQTSEGGQYYFILQAGNNVEIARSPNFDSESEADKAIKLCINEIRPQDSDHDNPYVSDGRGDNYRRLSFYQERISSTEDGFQTFKSDGKFFFTFNANGGIYIISEGYESEEGRFNGISSVKDNISKPDRIQSQQHPNGKSYFNLKAGNNKEIATSIWFDSTAAMQSAIDSAKSTGTSQADKTTIMKKNLDEYLDCKDYKGHPRSAQYPDFSTFEHDKEFYFAMLDDKDGVALRSEGYTSEKGRDNGIESVIKNREIEERFKVIKIKGKYHLSLLAGNHQEIARSCAFASSGSAKKALLGGGKVAAAPKKRKKKRTTPKVPKVEVGAGSYPCSGISYKIFKSGNGKHYFTYRDKDDKAILISSNIRGYETIEETEAVIKAIAANGSKAGNFEERPTTNGKFYYYLKNDDGKNIGKSFFFNTESEMRATIKLLDCGIAAAGASGAASSDRRDDDYLVCSAYEGNDIDEDGFSRFTNNGEFFFAMHDSDSSVKLRSERYTSESGRDNGIESAKKNRELSERYKIEEVRNIFYVILKAGNHQEIGRSCPYKTRAEAEAHVADPIGVLAAAAALKTKTEARAKRDAEALAIADTRAKKESAVAAGSSSKPMSGQDDYLKCSTYEGHDIADGFSRFSHDAEHYFAMHDASGKVSLRSEGYTTIKARENGIDSVRRNRDNEKRWAVEEKMDYHFVILKAGNHQEIGRSCPYKDAATATSIASKAAGGFAAAGIAAGLGGGTSGDADATEKAVALKLATADAKKAADARAKAESEAKRKSEEAVTAAKAKVEAEAAAKKAAEGKAVLEAKAKADAAKAKQDDYLKCADYKGHKKSSIHKDFVAFEKEGEHFFAWIGKDGEVILRSERYQTAKARDKGIDSVLRNRKQEKRWSVEEKMGYHFSILKAANHQEIGRSCPNKDKAAAGWNPLWFAGAATVAAAVAGIPKSTPPPPKKKKVVAAAAKGAGLAAAAGAGAIGAGAGAAATTAAAAGGGSSWWKWILGLALLGLLLWLLFCKGCFNCNSGAADIADDKDPKEQVMDKSGDASTGTMGVDGSSSEAANALGADKGSTADGGAGLDSGNANNDTDKAGSGDQATTAAAMATCNCNNQTNKVFKLPAAGTYAKKLPFLGSNPEFGNIHNLDGAGFYNKLKQRHTASGTDRRFLDGIFRAMGYENGFAGASAGIFSQVELPRGQKGNLGYGKQHGTGYYTLPDASEHRQAFKIKAANGCHLHFMKTCGNHMFFCPN